MGLINSLMQGLGEGAKAMSPYIQNMQVAEIQKLRDDRLAQLALDADQKKRDLMTSSIEKAKSGLIESDMSRKYAESDAAVAAADAGQTGGLLTAEQKSIIQGSKDADRASMIDSPSIAARAALKAGYPAEASAAASIGNLEADNQRQDKKMASDDEKWRTQFNELTRHNKAIEAKAAAELNLKQEDRTALSDGMRRYMSLVSFRGSMDKSSSADDLARVDADINGLAASMAQFGIKMPSVERKGDPLSSIVSGAKLISDSMDATDEQKKEATDTVSSALKHYGSKFSPDNGQGTMKYTPGQILEKKDGSKWRVDVKGVPQRM